MSATWEAAKPSPDRRRWRWARPTPVLSWTPPRLEPAIDDTLIRLLELYRGLPIGSYINEDGKRRKLGSRISEAAGRGGGNFLPPEIAHTARRETAYREIGALIDAERLATNSLSSMPLERRILRSTRGGFS